MIVGLLVIEHQSIADFGLVENMALGTVGRLPLSSRQTLKVTGDRWQVHEQQ